MEFPGLRPGAEAAGNPGIAVLHILGRIDGDVVLGDDRRFGGGVGGGEGVDEPEVSVGGLIQIVRSLLDADGEGVEGAAEDTLGAVRDIPMHQVRADVVLGVEFSGTDVAGVGAAVDVDEFVEVGALLIGDVAGVVVDLIGLVAQGATHDGGLVKGSGGVVHGAEGAVVDLLEVACALVAVASEFLAEGGCEIGIDVEGDGAGAEAEGVEAGVGVVDGGLEGIGGGG